MGYSVTVTPPAGDQGADLILQGREGTIAVQAKRYSGSVGNTAVQEVVAAKAFYQCVFAWIVCTSDYTRSAHALAQANEVDLWDRQKLNDALRRFGVLKNDKP